MVSGLQALEALGWYPGGNQRTTAFLYNRGATDYQLGNYKSSPVQNGPNANFVSQNESDYQTFECYANISVMPQQNTSTDIDLSTSNFGSASAAEGSCSIRPEDRNFPSYEELYSFWVQWKDRVDKCHCGMESIKFEEKDFFQPYTGAHKLFLVSANFLNVPVRPFHVFLSARKNPILKKKRIKPEIWILTFECLHNYKTAISKIFFHFQVIKSI